jgi:hypothetical protein
MAAAATLTLWRLDAHLGADGVAVVQAVPQGEPLSVLLYRWASPPGLAPEVHGSARPSSEAQKLSSTALTGVVGGSLEGTTTAAAVKARPRNPLLALRDGTPSYLRLLEALYQVSSSGALTLTYLVFCKHIMLNVPLCILPTSLPISAPCHQSMRALCHSSWARPHAGHRRPTSLFLPPLTPSCSLFSHLMAHFHAGHRRPRSHPCARSRTWAPHP